MFMYMRCEMQSRCFNGHIFSKKTIYDKINSFNVLFIKRLFKYLMCFTSKHKNISLYNSKETEIRHNKAFYSK